jgi:CBS domain-containing protein
MKQNEAISKIMATDLITVNTTESYSEVKARMEKACVHHLPVVEGHRLLGVISDRDLLKYAVSKAFSADDSKESDKLLDPHVSISDVMTKDLVTLKDNDTVKHAVEIFNKHSFHSIPVINEKEELVGMLSSVDVMNHFSKQY